MRISNLLVNLENTGIVISRAYSHGRGGYGKEYKLKVDPHLVGPFVDTGFYDSLVEKKVDLDAMRKHQKAMKKRKSIFGKKYPGLFGNL